MSTTAIADREARDSFSSGTCIIHALWRRSRIPTLPDNRRPESTGGSLKKMGWSYQFISGKQAKGCAFSLTERYSVV